MTENNDVDRNRLFANIDAKLTELSIKDEQEMMKAIIDGTAIITVSLTTGLITGSTYVAEQMFGYLSHELRGQPLSILIPPDRREIHEKHFSKFVDEPIPRQMGNRGMILEGYTKQETLIKVEIGLIPCFIKNERSVIAIIVRAREGG